MKICRNQSRCRCAHKPKECQKECRTFVGGPWDGEAKDIPAESDSLPVMGEEMGLLFGWYIRIGKYMLFRRTAWPYPWATDNCER